MIRFAFLLLITALAFAQQGAAAKGDPARGERIARDNCKPCHAISRTGQSPNPNAPHFRDLSKRYPLRDLEEGLAEGIVVGHEGAQMPMFQLGVGEIDNLIAYLQSIQTRRAKHR